MSGVKNSTMGWNWKQLLSMAGLFIFVVLPLIKIPVLIDHAYTPRWLLTGLLVSLTALYFLLKQAESGIRLKSLWFILPVLILLWMLIRCGSSVNPGEAFAELLRFALLFAVFWISRLLIQKDSGNLKAFLFWSPFAVFILSGYGLMQLMPQIQLFLEHGTPLKIDWRIASSLGNKNFFAEVLLMLCPFLLLCIQFSGKSIQYTAAVALLLVFLWQILLKSVGVWLAMTGSIAVIFLLSAYFFNQKLKHKYSRYIRSAVILVVVLVISAVVLMRDNPLQQKINLLSRYINEPELFRTESKLNNNSVYERLLAWRNSYKLIKENPMLGVGMNNWKIEQAKFGVGGTEFLNSGHVHFEHPHNDYLLIWSEQGLPGLILYCSFFLILIFQSIRRWKHLEDAQQRSIALWLLFGIISCLFISLLAYPRSRFYVSLLLMLQCGFLSALLSKAESSKLSKTHHVLFFGLVVLIGIWSSIAAFYRLQSEYHLKRAQVFKLKMNFPRMLREIDKTSMFWYPLDNSTTPLIWYKGQAAFYSGNAMVASKFFEEALEHNPYHIRVLNDLATAYEQTDRRSAAIDLYKQGLNITPGFIEGKLNLSAAYYNSGNYQQAFETISGVNPASGSDREKENYKLYRNAIVSAYWQELSARIQHQEFRDSIAEKLADKEWLDRQFALNRERSGAQHNWLEKLCGLK